MVDGPFTDFIGVVDSINAEKNGRYGCWSIFGRETPVELDFLQVSRIPPEARAAGAWQADLGFLAGC